MKHRTLTQQEYNDTLIQILDTLLDLSVPYSGKHRQKQWEKGWNENVKANDTTPRYFGKYKVNRLNGEFVVGLSKDYEQKMLYTIVDSLAKKYLKNVDHIVEFGCGTGHNLERIGKINKTAVLWGGDWVKSSQKIVERRGMNGFRFNFFKKNRFIYLKKNTGVITVAALEQVGTNYKNFVSFLLRNKPEIVVHIEPIPELLDPTDLLDYLSIKYTQKRRYLSGYLDYLRELEKKGKVQIIEARRSGIGSLFIDGYSIICWKPL